MPSLSIIIPVFNGVRYLPYFLESLAKAILPHAQIIFVDDASSEPVFDIIPDELAGVSVIKLGNERNLGYSATVNRGFSCAGGDILIQLNTDLVLDPNCIATMVEVIERSPNVGIVGSKQLSPTTGVIKSFGMAFGQRNYYHVFWGMPANHPLCAETRIVQLVNGATAAMTKKVLDDIGPLDERYYNTHENADHCLKAHSRGYTNYVCAESVVHHWVSQSGPARFAKVEEDDALFWSEWYARRTIDLGRFVDEALGFLLTRYPQLTGFPFEPLSLCRGYDESILLDRLERHWPGAAAKVRRSGIFNSSSRKLWLPMELPHWVMAAPSPFIYLVDRIGDLSENRLWFEARHRLVEFEIIMDTNATVLTSDQFLGLIGAPLA